MSDNAVSDIPSPDNKVIMISGASRGIGLAVAKKLLKCGYRISLGVRNPDKVSALFAASDSLLITGYDAKIKADADKWVNVTHSHFGRIDALINCAGILKVIQLLDDDEDALDEMWEVNVKAPMRLIRRAWPYLKAHNSGRVITVVSLSGKRVKGLSAGYAMTKFAQLALSHSVRVTGWDDGIRACAICPSWVNTEMVKNVAKLPPDDMIQPDTLAQLIEQILVLPNNASVAELTVNCGFEPTC